MSTPLCPCGQPLSLWPYAAAFLGAVPSLCLLCRNHQRHTGHEASPEPQGDAVPKKPQKPVRPRTYDMAQVEALVAEWIALHNRVPTVRDFADDLTLPSHSAVCRFFGGSERMYRTIEHGKYLSQYQTQLRAVHEKTGKLGALTWRRNIKGERNG